MPDDSIRSDVAQVADLLEMHREFTVLSQEAFKGNDFERAQQCLDATAEIMNDLMPLATGVLAAEAKVLDKLLDEKRELTNRVLEEKTRRLQHQINQLRALRSKKK